MVNVSIKKNSEIIDINNNTSVDDKIATDALNENIFQEFLVDELHTAIEKTAILDIKFFAVDLSRSTTKNIIARCQFCPGEKFYKGSLRTTSNFSSHLKILHKANYDEYKEYLKNKRSHLTNISSTDRKRWSCSFHQEKFKEDLTHFIFDSTLPINIVKRPSFHRIFDNLQIKKGEIQFKHLSRYSLGQRIKIYVNESLNEIQNHLQSITSNNGFVCTTADVWTSGSKRFLGVTVSWQF
ncbi:hypothetical protein KQX54_013872 [Cotesia glomerata]|uniref:Uncharacterized protein n=1 Tax=Cotesia glomerata TaxID=32391 RepID=A0AAV7I2T6_COTGL|nr:hypothetical protein KQX54_013872 [Cotesia glomerata]